MSSNRVRHLLVTMVAVLVFSVIAAGAAQAKQATYWHLNAAITAGLKIEDASLRSRLWAVSLGAIVVCAADTSKGEIEAGGVDKGEVTYTKCKMFKTKENTTTHQIEEGAQLTLCAVRSSTAAIGSEEIKVTGLKSKLVYVKGSAEKEILTLFEPTAQPFVTLKIEGASCAVPEGNYEVKGSVLGRVPRINEEAIMGNILFETINEAKMVTQRYTTYEGPAKEEHTGVELKLGNNVAALESTEQVELEVVGGMRGLFDVHN